MAKQVRSGNPVGRPRHKTGHGAGPDTRQRVLKAARSLLATRGYSGVLLDEVALEAGLTRASLYHHFPGGKDELMLAVSLQVLDEGRDGFAALLQQQPSVQARLEALARWLFSRADQAERLVREATPHMPPEHAQQVYQRFMTEMHTPIVAVLETGILSGEVPPHDPVFGTWVFLSLVAGLPGAGSGQTPDELAVRVVNWFLQGLMGQTRPSA